VGIYMLKGWLKRGDKVDFAMLALWVYIVGVLMMG